MESTDKNSLDRPSVLRTGDQTVRIDMQSLLDRREGTDTGTLAPLDPEAYTGDPDKLIASLTPKPFDKYEYKKSIGRGGMKVVIEVRDRDTDRDIAMAILPDAANRPREDTLRFIEEARIAASLEHPNIVPIHDIGVDHTGSPYFTMKLLRGETLASVLKKLENGDSEYLRLYPLERRLRIFLKILSGVAFAHSKGVLHLDLKPANVQLGDFEEVQLMDWGLARVIGIGADKGKSSGIGTGPGAGADGITKGTPGYMAPEQAAGKNSSLDGRTDIYSLGAILYSILTLKNPMDTEKNVEEIFRDTVTGKIVPPRLRSPELMIPAAIEAVAMKALSLRPGDRYATAKEMASDVNAFLRGYATRAERASFFRKSMLFFYRNRKIVPVFLLLVLVLTGVGLYAFREKKRLETGWIPGISSRFENGRVSGSPWSCMSSSMLSVTPLWQCGKEGLSLRPGEWLWYDENSLKGSLRVVADFIPSQHSDFLLAINSAPTVLRYTWNSPPGYQIRFAASSRLLMLSRNPSAGSAETIATVSVDSSSVRIGKTNQLTWERNDGLFTVTLNGKTVLEASDLFPLRTSGGRIGLYAFSGVTLLEKLEAFAMALPIRSSPVLAGDVLVENGHYSEAVDKYVSLADSYVRTNRLIAEEALVKANFIAVSHLKAGKRRTEILASIKSRILSTFSVSRYRDKILEYDAIQQWMDRKYTRALDIAEELSRLDPNTGIIQKLLQLKHEPLEKEEGKRLLRNAARIKDLRHLNVSRLGLVSLEELKNVPLLYLDCSHNELTDLRGTEGMPLEYLDCSYNQIGSLLPLKDASLKELYCFCNRISGLDGLNTGNLSLLFAARNRIGNVTALRGARRLISLDIRDNSISSLAPLEELSLNTLVAGENPIRNVSCLKGMPLRELYLDSTEIRSVAPLEKLPLVTLSLYQCTGIRSVAPLMKLADLQMLSLPPKAEDVDLLRKHPALRYLTDSEMIPANTPRSSAELFWKNHGSR